MYKELIFNLVLLEALVDPNTRKNIEIIIDDKNEYLAQRTLQKE